MGTTKKPGDWDVGDLIKPGDILDVKGLAAKIRERGDPFSEFLHGRIQPETRKILLDRSDSKSAVSRIQKRCPVN